MLQFHKMSDRELIEHCRKLYDKAGIDALSYDSLSGSLYRALYKRGITQKKLIQLLELKEAYYADQNTFKHLSDRELIDYCKDLYNKHGIKALSYEYLSKQGSLYQCLYSRGFSQAKLVSLLKLKKEYAEYKIAQPIIYRDGTIIKRWTWERILQETTAIQKKEGFLPPAAWFQSNDYSPIVAAVYSLGKTWEQLRHELGDFKSSSFVESRNGVRWRSHPEASLSNFLYARGIEHKRGERYPDGYGKQFNYSYAYFDLHFCGSDNTWIDVEIWGDRPNGHNEEGYSHKRAAKEDYNQNNPRFLGIHFQDCYSEDALIKILEPYIGIHAPYRFDRPTDPLIPTSHWSNTDELLAYCREIAALAPNGTFPTEEWLRKRGKWSSREGPAYNTASIYIKTWFGGVRKLRQLLGQAEVSTKIWNREIAIAAYKDFYEKYGITPRQARRSTDKLITDIVRKEAGAIASAVEKHASGCRAVNLLLGINVDRAGRVYRKEA